ncbi:hypothetical protein KFZ56_14790 [Virgibacillus sp. NKC19-3]|uniref:hypothetical protein n=1 Tax=Virgibacillus saliphilus TaxID=2831674 RepID=UPI001C9B67DB|nr:hypothetical protein [Virgibacillus sp. NKC19-3]MBY7144289.1 hypothetical protein [Virgibacillus sp. NKC19-3]
MSQKSDREKKVYKEIEGKVKMLDDDSYDFGPSMNKLEVCLIIVIAVISVLGLIWGGI